MQMGRRCRPRAVCRWAGRLSTLGFGWRRARCLTLLEWQQVFGTAWQHRPGSTAHQGTRTKRHASCRHELPHCPRTAPAAYRPDVRPAQQEAQPVAASRADAQYGRPHGRQLHAPAAGPGFTLMLGSAPASSSSSTLPSSFSEQAMSSSRSTGWVPPGGGGVGGQGAGRGDRGSRGLTASTSLRRGRQAGLTGSPVGQSRRSDPAAGLLPTGRAAPWRLTCKHGLAAVVRALRREHAHVPARWAEHARRAQ